MSKPLPREVTEAIRLAYRINGVVGQNVEGIITQLWGDPDAINRCATAWTNAANVAENSSQALRDEVTNITGEHWKGPAASAYISWMQSLQQHSIDNLAWCFRKVGDILAGVTQDVREMNEYISKVCAEFVTVTAALILKGKMGEAAASGPKGGKAGIAAAIAAAADLVRRLYEIENSFDQKLAPRNQELQREVATVSDSSNPDACRIGYFTWQQPSKDAPPLKTHVFAAPYHFDLIGYWDRWE